MLPLLVSLALSAPLDDLLMSEVTRAQDALSERERTPHYIALQVEDRTEWDLQARYGTVFSKRSDQARYLDVDLRVGTPELDSTHELRGFSALDGDTRRVTDLPLSNALGVLRHAVWKAIDQQYRDADERIVLVRANQQVKVEEEETAPDFIVVPEARIDDIVGDSPDVDLDAWQPILVEISQILDTSDRVRASSVDLGVEHVVKTFVDSEGSRLSHDWTHGRLSMTANTTAEDGDVVGVYEAIDVHDPASLPDREALLRTARAVVERVEALHDAPRGEPYSGPVLLMGRATGVFFHEVLGHRVEGHRQKREDEGHTFADHVGRSVLPEWIDVYDDPTIDVLAGVDLNGHYTYDDEGMRAMRASIVEDGDFQGFLMGRSPIQGFDTSNGHGRRSVGNAPVSRMGNTIVEASETVPFEVLKQGLRDQAREQGLEYGILVEAIDGGFTLTGRQMPNAFNVRASASWRVFVDGRPDELVRGIDLVGTPFGAFSSIVAAGEAPEVFNGFCGAESGWVPVSAVAPPILFERLEFQLKEKAQERPPLLAKPHPTAAPGGDS